MGEKNATFSVGIRPTLKWFFFCECDSFIVVSVRDSEDDLQTLSDADYYAPPPRQWH